MYAFYIGNAECTYVSKRVYTISEMYPGKPVRLATVVIYMCVSLYVLVLAVCLARHRPHQEPAAAST